MPFDTFIHQGNVQSRFLANDSLVTFNQLLIGLHIYLQRLILELKFGHMSR